jgi:hypothetical protein
MAFRSSVRHPMRAEIALHKKHRLACEIPSPGILTWDAICVRVKNNLSTSRQTKHHHHVLARQQSAEVYLKEAAKVYLKEAVQFGCCDWCMLMDRIIPGTRAVYHATTAKQMSISSPLVPDWLAPIK